MITKENKNLLKHTHTKTLFKLYMASAGICANFKLKH